MPAALMRFALHSKAGNDKHNPGEPIHHARGKSMDHVECIARHLFDMQDIQAYIARNGDDPHVIKLLLDEATAEFWHAGIFLHELCEKYEGAPLAPAARLPEPPIELTPDEPHPMPAVPSGTVEQVRESLGVGTRAVPIRDEPVAQMPDEGAPRCGHMLRTRRVCTRVENHAGPHADTSTQWEPEAGETRSPAG